MAGSVRDPHCVRVKPETNCSHTRLSKASSASAKGSFFGSAKTCRGMPPRDLRRSLTCMQLLMVANLGLEQGALYNCMVSSRAR